jgi:hypothetical protein
VTESNDETDALTKEWSIPIQGTELIEAFNKHKDKSGKDKNGKRIQIGSRFM